MYLALIEIAPWVHFALLAGAIFFSFAAGYTFGWAVPHWADDSSLEDPGIRGSHAYGYGGYGYGYGEGGCLLPMVLGAIGFASVRRTTYAPIVTAVLAIACILLLWDPEPAERVESPEFFLLFHKPLWLGLLAAVVGYVFARVSDKGPVGPLE